MHKKAYLGVCLGHHGVSICPSLSQLALSHGHSKLKLFGRWMTKGFWAVSDQGLFSVSNFVVNVLLARWLLPQDYGAFAVAFTIFLLMGTFHTALLTEPMLVFGPSTYKDKDRLSTYLGTLLYGHLGFAALSGLLLLMIGLGFGLFGRSAVATVLVTLAFAGPLIFLLWLMRRACYVRFEPHLATLGGALYMVLLLGGIYALYRLEWLSTTSALGAMGFSSLIVSLWLYVRLRVSRPARREGIVREAFNDHWRYGRWAMATSILTWAPANIYFLLLPIWSGLEATASLRALLNLIMPMQQAVVALGTLLLAALAQARGQAKFDSLVRFALVPFILGPALFWLFLGAMHKPLAIWLYGGRYVEHTYLLWILGLLPVIAGVIAVIGGSLRALEQLDRVFFAYALSTVVALTLGAGFAFLWGLLGVVIALVASYATTMMVMLFYWRLERHNLNQGGEQEHG